MPCEEEKCVIFIEERKVSLKFSKKKKEKNGLVGDLRLIVVIGLDWCVYTLCRKKKY